MSSSSKYPFYITLTDYDGLFMGQHVYIELDVGQTEAAALTLPEYYLLPEENGAFVYAASARGRIEKRAVTLGAYDALLGTYEIVDGLTAEDRIAFPDETVKPGMTIADAGYAAPDAEMMDGMAGMDGEEAILLG